MFIYKKNDNVSIDLSVNLLFTFFVVLGDDVAQALPQELPVVLLLGEVHVLAVDGVDDGQGAQEPVGTSFSFKIF